MKALGRISLVLVLAISALLELLLNRVGIHIVGRVGGITDKLVDGGGLFAFYFTGLVGIVVFGWATIVLIADKALLPIGSRVALMLTSAVFLPLAGMGLVFRLPAPVAPFLNVSFGAVLVALVGGFVARPAPIRAKLGVLYLCAPMLLHCYWLMTQQISGLGPSGQGADLPARLLGTGQHMVVVGAFAAFLFFTPFPRWSALLDPMPVIFSAVCTTALGLLVVYNYPMAAKAAYYGLSINLPPPDVREVSHLAIYIAAFFFFVLAVATLFFRDQLQRNSALGLALIAFSGFHLQLPYQFLLTLVGMIQLVRGAMALQEQRAASERAAECAPSPSQWKAYLGRIADACGAASSEAVVLQGESGQIARVRGRLDDLSFAVRVQVRAGLVQELEIDVGQPPKDDAPVSLLRQRRRRGRRVPDGRAPRVSGFDDQIVLRDGIGEAAEVFTPYSPRLNRWLHGWLGVWPAEGLRYLARPLEDGWPVSSEDAADDQASTDDLEQLLQLLLDLARDFEVK